MIRRLKLDATPACMGFLRGQIRSFLEEASCPLDCSEQIVLAIDEACTNIIRHAHAGATLPVRFRMQRLHRAIRFTIRDHGTPCDPSRLAPRDLSEVRPGGLGLHIIHSVFDRVHYAPRPRGTLLILEKSIPPGH
jgi:anti-sigma regulatory factor (Ser/Thr protein kinase)